LDEEQFWLQIRWTLGYTPEQLARLSERNRNCLRNLYVARDYRMFAEVVKAENCGLRPNIGDKYVFSLSGFLRPEESSIPRVCLWALAPMLSYHLMVHDRVSEGRAVAGELGRVKCADLSVECGGFGEAIFKLYCDKAQGKD